MTYTGRHIHLWYKLQLNIRLPKKKQETACTGFHLLEKNNSIFILKNPKCAFWGKQRVIFWGWRTVPLVSSTREVYLKREIVICLSFSRRFFFFFLQTRIRMCFSCCRFPSSGDGQEIKKKFLRTFGRVPACEGRGGYTGYSV